MGKQGRSQSWKRERARGEGGSELERASTREDAAHSERKRESKKLSTTAADRVEET